MPLIVFAYSEKTKELIDISSVPSGMKCNCECPSCGMKLIARKGDVNEHHFAHKEEATTFCEYSYWVSVRDMSMQIIQKSSYINLHRYNLENLHKNIFVTKEKRVEIHQVKEFNGEEFDLLLRTSIGDLYLYLKTDEEKFIARDYRHESQRKLYFSKELILSINITDFLKIKNNFKEELTSMLIDSTLNKRLLKPKEKYNEPIDAEVEELSVREKTKMAFDHKRHERARTKTTNNIVSQEIPLRKLTYVKDSEILHLMNLHNEELLQRDIRVLNTMKNFYQLHVKINQNNKSEALTKVYTGVDLTLISYRNSLYGLALIKGYFYAYQVEDEKILYIGQVKNMDSAKKEIDYYLDAINTLF
jgi:hypothetical protein